MREEIGDHDARGIKQREASGKATGTEGALRKDFITAAQAMCCGAGSSRQHSCGPHAMLPAQGTVSEDWQQGSELSPGINASHACFSPEAPCERQGRRVQRQGPCVSAELLIFHDANCGANQPSSEGPRRCKFGWAQIIGHEHPTSRAAAKHLKQKNVALYNRKLVYVLRPKWRTAGCSCLLASS